MILVVWTLSARTNQSKRHLTAHGRSEYFSTGRINAYIYAHTQSTSVGYDAQFVMIFKEGFDFIATGM